MYLQVQSIRQGIAYIGLTCQVSTSFRAGNLGTQHSERKVVIKVS
jgi:hypothetical protein